MVSALNPGSSRPGSSPGRGTALCHWARHFTLILPLFIQVYKWVLVNLLLGGNTVMDQHPIQGGSRNTPSRFMRKTLVKLWPDGKLGSYANLIYLLSNWYCRCYRCGNKSKRLSRFYELDLNIQGHTALSQCIKEFLKVEKFVTLVLKVFLLFFIGMHHVFQAFTLYTVLCLI